MNNSQNQLKKLTTRLWAGIFLVFIMLLAGIILIYTQYVKAVFDNNKGVGSILTHQEWNELPTELGAPSGGVMAFNLPACPVGWTLADGLAGRPDLRGVFIRGLDMGSGVDPGRSLNTYQADDFDLHGHPAYYSRETAGTKDATGYIAIDGSGPFEIHNANSGNPEQVTSDQNTNNIGGSGGSETRPKNVALIYCVKD